MKASIARSTAVIARWRVAGSSSVGGWILIVVSASRPGVAAAAQRCGLFAATAAARGTDRAGTGGSFMVFPLGVSVRRGAGAVKGSPHGIVSTNGQGAMMSMQVPPSQISPA